MASTSSDENDNRIAAYILDKNKVLQTDSDEDDDEYAPIFQMATSDLKDFENLSWDDIISKMEGSSSRQQQNDQPYGQLNNGSALPASDPFLPLLKSMLARDQQKIADEGTTSSNAQTKKPVSPEILEALKYVESKPWMESSYYLPLYRAALRGDWEIAKVFFENDPEAATVNITPGMETALSLAVRTGRSIEFVRNLLNMMPEAAIKKKNNTDQTVLATAGIVGNIEAARLLVGKCPDLIYIATSEGMLPLHFALKFGHKEMFSYLLKMTKDDVEPNVYTGINGAILLGHTIKSDFVDIALNLARRYPDLTTISVFYGESAISNLASRPTLFPSGSKLRFWERLIYSLITVKNESPNSSSRGGEVENPLFVSETICGCFLLVARKFLAFAPCYARIRQMKQMHDSAIELVKHLCSEIVKLDYHKAAHLLLPAFLSAAENGAHEVVEEILDSFPMAIWFQNLETKQFVFQLAVKERQENVFNLLYQTSGHEPYVIQSVDAHGNNILHLAGKLAPLHRLNLVSGAALQMQQELLWFKEVEKLVKPFVQDAVNHEGKKPKMVFTEEHKELVKEGEKWLKDTATSCTINAALIATVVFAAAITIPGGNNENGLAIFSKQKAFTVFAVSDALSLFSSTAAILMFLSILTARYAEDDFLYALPKRLIFGLFSLVLAIASMMVSFVSTIYLVFGARKAWILIPVGISACLPVSLFVTSQFPLLVDMIYSTYGRGKFGKTSNRVIY